MDELLAELTASAAAALTDPRERGRTLVYTLVAMDDEQRRMEIGTWRAAVAHPLAREHVADARRFLHELLAMLPYTGDV